MDNSKFFEKAIAWAEKKGFKEIKANIEDYETPKGYNRPGEDDAIVPDITGYQSGAKCYVEIALKSDDVRARVSKWKLLATLASMKGGKLYLLAPRGHKAFTEKAVINHSLNAQIISI